MTRNSGVVQNARIVTAFLVGFMVLTEPAFAADELGDGICQLVNVLTGKWLFGIAVLAMLGAGSALMFGAELSDGVKKMVTIVTIVGMIVSFSSILAMAFSKLSAAAC